VFMQNRPNQGSTRPQRSAPLVLDAARVSALSDAPDLGRVTYTVVREPPPAARAATPSAAADKRSSNRQRTPLRSGKVVDLGDRFIVECFVHNRSTSGARLRLVDAKPLPAIIKVYDDQHKTLSTVRVVWQRRQDVGVRFDWRLDVGEARRAFVAALGEQFYAVPG
jgi:PilZ domain